MNNERYRPRDPDKEGKIVAAKFGKAQLEALEILKEKIRKKTNLRVTKSACLSLAIELAAEVY